MRLDAEYEDWLRGCGPEVVPQFGNHPARQGSAGLYHWDLRHSRPRGRPVVRQFGGSTRSQATVIEVPQNTHLAADFVTGTDTWSYAAESAYRDVLLSPSGYPIVALRYDLPLCGRQSEVKDAMDAWRAKDKAWLSQMSDCGVFLQGFKAELLKGVADALFNTLPVRIIMPDKSRVTLYAPGGISGETLPPSHGFNSFPRK